MMEIALQMLIPRRNSEIALHNEDWGGCLQESPHCLQYALMLLFWIVIHNFILLSWDTTHPRFRTCSGRNEVLGAIVHKLRYNIKSH